MKILSYLCTRLIKETVFIIVTINTKTIHIIDRCCPPCFVKGVGRFCKILFVFIGGFILLFLICRDAVCLVLEG